MFVYNYIRENALALVNNNIRENTLVLVYNYIRENALALVNNNIRENEHVFFFHAHEKFKRHRIQDVVIMAANVYDLIMYSFAIDV